MNRMIECPPVLVIKRLPKKIHTTMGGCCNIIWIFVHVTHLIGCSEASPPILTVSPDYGVHLKGKSLTLTCNVFNDYSNKQFSFYKDSKSIFQSDKTYNYKIQTLDYTHGGRYTCQYWEAGYISPISEGILITVSASEDMLLKLTTQQITTNSFSPTVEKAGKTQNKAITPRSNTEMQSFQELPYAEFCPGTNKEMDEDSFYSDG
ncbi:uncharacterized protein [Hyperolius riggenbachi]|uniref:uncharacterized protein isoform X3 n=1 Tax=Hyperolius riggenbachi TaxID=752182 RepID=UPI0035A2B39A